MKDVARQILLLLISACIGYFISEYKTKRDNRMNFIDYYLLATPDVFNRFSSPTPQISVKVGDKEVTKVSQLEVVLENPGGRDFEDVPVFIDLIANEGGSFEVVGKSIVGDSGLTDSISGVSLREIEKSPQTIRCSFTIRTVNRGKTWNMRPRATFLTTGDRIPRVRIETSKAGLGIREYKAEYYDPVIKPFSFIIIGYILTVVISFMVMRSISKRYFRRIYKDSVRKVKECLLANRSRLAGASDETLQLCAFDVYIADGPDEIHERIRSLRDFLKKNAEVLQNTPDSVATDMAKHIVERDIEAYRKIRPKWRNLLSPMPRFEYEDA